MMCKRAASHQLLHLSGQVIRTTADHAFYVAGQGWTAAADLHVGGKLRTGRYFQRATTASGAAFSMRSGTSLLQQAGTEITGGFTGGTAGNAISQSIDLLTGHRQRFSLNEMLTAGVQGVGTGLTAWGIHRAATGWRAECFVAGTPIPTFEGHRPIEQFRRGDRLLARSETNLEGPIQEREVLDVFVSRAPILDIRIGERVIQSTHEHPFWVRGKGWTAANKLGAGDELSSRDGRWIAVDGVVDNGEEATVYNVLVDEYHTYFV